MSDSGMSDAVSAGPSTASLASFAQASTAPTDVSFDFLARRPQLSQSPKVNGGSPVAGSKHDGFATPQRRGTRDRKRPRLASETDGVESVDYWIQFDDDEPDNMLGQSFEIDYSKRRNNLSSLNQTQNGINIAATTPRLGTDLYSTRPLKVEELVEDTALDNALSDDDEDLFELNLGSQLGGIGSMPPTEVPPREGLYSTPLSWERPRPGLGNDPFLGGLGATWGGGGGGATSGYGYLGGPTVLSDVEQRRLLAIALGPGRVPIGFTAGIGLPFGSGTGSGVPTSSFTFGDGKSPGVGGLQQAPGSSGKQTQGAAKNSAATAGCSKTQSQLQRSNTGGSNKGSDKAKPTDRTAHNDIEKKYRTNLKERIAELRNAVPSLCSAPEDGADDESGTQAPKASKGMVLTKATEYIHQLEKKNEEILKEHQELAGRLQAFEQLLSASARQPFLMPNYSRTLFDPRGFC